VAQARSDHPALDGVEIRSAAEPRFEGLAESIGRHGADALTEGMVAILMTFIELLGRLIGEDMALKLIDQSMPSRGPGADVTGQGGAS
jgi:hypothetical protein